MYLCVLSNNMRDDQEYHNNITAIRKIHRKLQRSRLKALVSLA